jgi:hypothetical protein
LKEAKFESNDVLRDPWQVTTRTSGTLEIVLSTRTGQIEGKLVDAQSQKVGGIQVVLIPDQERERTELYRSAISDSNGNFSLRAIPPGGYRLFGWESIDPTHGLTRRSCRASKRKASLYLEEIPSPDGSMPPRFTTPFAKAVEDQLDLHVVDHLEYPKI